MLKYNIANLTIPYLLIILPFEPAYSAINHNRGIDRMFLRIVAKTIRPHGVNQAPKCHLSEFNLNQNRLGAIPLLCYLKREIQININLFPRVLNT
jgi:hypothetical protein